MRTSRVHGPALLLRYAGGMRHAGLLVAVVLIGAACSHPSQNTSGTSSPGGGPGGSSSTSRAGGSSGTATTTSSTATGTSTCQPSKLSAAEGQSLGAAGTIQSQVIFTNTAATACTLDGYPGMQLVGSAGRNLPTNVVRGGVAGVSVSPNLVHLAPGSKASFSLSYSDVPVGTETTCPESASADVTPPNDYTTVPVALKIAPCANGTVHVSPVYPGTVPP